MFVVCIRRNADGVERVTEEKDYEYSEWVWSEGNIGCDCNRHLFFIRAGGESEPEKPEELPCGSDKYSIPWIKVDGKVVYSETEEY